MKKLGISIGLNAVDPKYYNGWGGKLNACENDAKNMKALFDSVGVEDTALILTKNATRANVRQEIHQAIEKLEEGGVLYISYSGHGGQIPDLENEEEDNKDETWCLYDGHMVDDTLSYLFQSNKSIYIIVFSDSCHSGTVTRDFGTTPRVMPPSALNKKSYERTPLNITVSYNKVTTMLMSGCQDNQLSYESGNFGAFTKALLEAYNGGKFVGSWKELHKKVVKALPPYQSPNLSAVGRFKDCIGDESAFFIEESI